MACWWQWCCCAWHCSKRRWAITQAACCLQNAVHTLITRTLPHHWQLQPGVIWCPVKCNVLHVQAAEPGHVKSNVIQKHQAGSTCAPAGNKLFYQAAAWQVAHNIMAGSSQTLIRQCSSLALYVVIVLRQLQRLQACNRMKERLSFETQSGLANELCVHGGQRCRRQPSFACRDLPAVRVCSGKQTRWQNRCDHIDAGCCVAGHC